MHAGYVPKARINPHALFFRRGNGPGGRDAVQDGRDAVQDEMDVEPLLSANSFPDKTAIPNAPRLGRIRGIGQSLPDIAVLRVDDRPVEPLSVANGLLLMLPNHPGGVVFPAKGMQAAASPAESGTSFLMEDPIRIRPIQIVGNDLPQVAVEPLFPSASLCVFFENLFEIIGRGQSVVLADLLKPLVPFRSFGEPADFLPLILLLHLSIPSEDSTQSRVAQLKSVQKITGEHPPPGRINAEPKLQNKTGDGLFLFHG